jgi:hypothetical protein
MTGFGRFDILSDIGAQVTSSVSIVFLAISITALIRPLHNTDIF